MNGWRMPVICGLGVALSAATARAQDPAPARLDGPEAAQTHFAARSHRAADPAAVQGTVRPSAEAGDTARAIGSVLLYLPRATAEAVFLATGTASGLVEDQQVVPRVRDLIFPRAWQIAVFPTAFVETGANPNIGARMIARADQAATSLRAGFGGPDEVVVESRVRLGRARPLPLVVDLEALHDRSTDLDYVGVGQAPETDPRNHFVGAAREAVYREAKTRGIASLGVRPTDDIELFLSASVTRRRVDDPSDAGPSAIGRVFEPASVSGAPGITQIFYGELALRLDTRSVRGEPSPGVVVEGYGGAARGLDRGDVHLARVGGRFALFFPLVRRSNIVSPKLVVDQLVRFPGATVPFTELTRQAEFRGIDDRRDDLSIVTSLDYRFVVMRYVAGRLFTDAATVAPDPAGVTLSHLRVAVGVGVDLFSSETDIGQLAIAGGPDGARLLLTFGVASGFGDRQHRD